MSKNIVTCKRHGLSGLLGLLLGLNFFIFACGSEDEDSSNGNSGLKPIQTIAYDGVGVDLDASGFLLSLAAKNQGITVYNTNNPAQPLVMSSFPLPRVYKTHLLNNSVFGFDADKGLVAANLLPQNQLKLTQSLSTVELYGFINDVVRVGSTFVFASEAIGLSTYKIGNEFNLVGGKSSSSNPSTQGATNIATLPGRLIAASYSGDMSTYIQEEGKALKLSNWAVTSHKISGFDCAIDYCYAAGLADGLFVYRTLVEKKPELVGSFEAERTIELVHIDEKLMYVSFLGSRGNNGWYVYDLSDPVKPRRIHTLTSEGIVKDFARVGTMVYVLLENGQLQIFQRESLM